MTRRAGGGGRFWRINIQQKLIALIGIPTAAIVLFLVVYFPAQHNRDIRALLTYRAENYGAILRTQLQSAVAFDDKATATEVLSSLAVDHDIAAMTLFGSSGTPLYRTGRPSRWVEQARRGVIAPKVFFVADRIAVVAPVVSMEGPRGTLVIEISTARLQAQQAATTRMAIQVGIAALVAAMLVAWLVARSMATRITRIADAAAAVAAGNLDRRAAVDSSSDEIAVLATAFNQMVLQLQTEQTTLEAMVRELSEADQALADANRELEGRVSARTAELVNSNEKLKHEMEERSKMEIVLRQAQKLESVGRLAAGVAHEINTPVQFVNDSIHFVRDAMKDLAGVIAGYQAACAALEETHAAIREAREAADAVELGYLLENVPRALDRTLDGLNRVTQIVRSMKEFAHPDQREMSAVNLNQAILATLTIATNEYKYVSEVETELGDLPMVTCHAGDVNQSVLNLVVNAAHAIGDVVRDSGEKGLIKVKTWLDESDVVIAISDTGGGIPAAVQTRIFEPFFTTKDVGRGTGQGLAIAHSVVCEKHGGKLHFETEPGKGTTFFIRLPIEGKKAPVEGIAA